MNIDIIDSKGQSTGKSIELPDDIFGIEPNEHAMYLAVKQYLAHQRQGTHKSKERAEIKGSTRKIKRQKGTGSARFGDIKNPLFRGGGRVFGPRPHKYTVKLNDKVKKLAKLSAFSAKANEGKVKVIQDFSFDTPSTKSMGSVLSAVCPEARRSILLTAENDRNLYLSGRNLTNFKIVEARNVNTYQLLNSSEILISESAVNALTQMYSSKA